MDVEAVADVWRGRVVLRGRGWRVRTGGSHERGGPGAITVMDVWQQPFQAAAQRSRHDQSRANQPTPRITQSSHGWIIVE